MQRRKCLRRKGRRRSERSRSVLKQYEEHGSGETEQQKGDGANEMSPTETIEVDQRLTQRSFDKTCVLTHSSDKPAGERADPLTSRPTC